MHQSPLLLAAAFDWLETLAGSAFVIIWIVSQVINLFRAAAKRPSAPAPPAADRRPAAPDRRPQRPRGAEGQTDVERQIEEFLRDRRRGEASAPARRPPPLPAPASAPARVTPAASRPPAAAEPSGSGVSRHVSHAFAHQLDHLSSGLAEAAAGPEPRPQPTGAGVDLVAALRSPATLRQLFLLREVFERPTERW